MNEPEHVQCVLCGHRFHPGNAEGFVYCPACGKRFNPGAPFEDTVAIPPPQPPPAGAAAEPPDFDLELHRDDAAPVSPSRRFGEYDIISEIARGGMGVVYLARQRVLKREVALKVLRSGDNASDEERARLLREAKAAAGLRHPNIVPIHEFSIHQGQPYFTMDFIAGQPLDRLLERGPLNVRRAVTIMETVARAIAYAHSRGIIHRDLKPANIIVDGDGRPMVTDFGLAADLSGDDGQKQRMTMAGSIMGTIPYAPPEQASGKLDQITERSDVYAMGAVLYEMVTERPPFTGFTQYELMRRVINQDPVPPRHINPKVHRDVETVILKCLEKDPRRRYDSARAFADDCASFLKGEVIAARPATLGYRVRRFLSRRPLLAILSLSVVLLSLAVWQGLRHTEILAKEKEATEQALENSLAMAERIAMEKEETEKQVRRDWRTEYTINFDYAFRWESDPERSRRLEIPWLNPQKASLLADPPRLALTEPPEAEPNLPSPPREEADLGFPIVFPRDVRVVLRIQTPSERVGELVLMLDVDRGYRPQSGTTTARFGSPGRPGAAFYRGEAALGEDPAFSLKPGATSELVIERTDGRIRALLDGRPVLEAEDPPAVFGADPGRLALDVKDGSLEFFDLSVELRGMSRNMASILVETANTMAARGRADLSLRLYSSVLLEPTDPQSRLRALRGYARSLWVGLPRRDRGLAGIENACQELNEQLIASGRSRPGEIDYLVALALAFNPATPRDGLLALERLDRAAAIAYSEGSGASDYGDLSRLEAVFVYLKLGMLDEATRRINVMFADGTAMRLYERFGAELGGGGQTALLLERADNLLAADAKPADLEAASSLLRAAAVLAPASRECANRFRRLALIHRDAGDAAKAAGFLGQAQKIAPDWFRPYLDEAMLHYAEGEAVKGEEVLARAASAMPQSLDLHLGVAKLYLDDLPERFRSPDKADAAAAAAMTLSQNLNAGALELSARAQMRLGRIEEALARITAALDLEKTDYRTALRDEISLLLHNKANGRAAP